MKRRAFTLVELLTVIAITAILLTLIILPVFQSFALTRNAQSFADAQEKGRSLTERVGREISNATSVRNPGGLVTTSLNGNALRVSRSALVIRVPRVGADGLPLTPTTYGEVVLPYTKMDLVNAAPRAGQDPSGGFRDPDTGRVDPTLANPKGPLQLPLAVGNTITRYFVGLNDPFREYTNPYDGLLTVRGAQRDNLYVLYRAEVAPMHFRPVTIGGNTRNMRIVDTRFFEGDPASQVAGAVDPDGNAVYLQPILDDPRFFTVNRNADGTFIDDAKAARIREWRKRAVIQTEVTRYDMILPAYDKARRTVANAGGLPAIQPLIQFRPSRTMSETLKGDMATRLGQERAASVSVGPDSFRSQYRLWTDPIVRLYPSTWVESDANRDTYLVGRSDPTGTVPGFSIYAWDPSIGGQDVTNGVELFDVTTYDSAKVARATYPFSRAVNAANGRTNWVNDPNLRALFRPFWLDTAKGRVVTSFGLDEVGDVATTPIAANPRNLPLLKVAADDAAQAYTPADDPQVAASANTLASFFQPEFGFVNARFNKLYDLVQKDSSNATGLRDVDASRIHRFIDLRRAVQGDGSPGPLDVSLGLNARIVPGSETIIGPDQNPGPNYGLPIRYTRVSGVAPGPNQYRINYADLVEPANYGLLGITAPALSGFDPNVYDANNIVSVVFQPQYKAGYVQFCSDPNVPLGVTPIGSRAGNIPTPIQIDYRFQFTGGATGTRRTDTLALDYDSRELMNVVLTIRNYPQSSGRVPNPQTVTLTASGNVRNLIR